MATFPERVAATVSAHHMISPGQVVLVALSGGADSTALLHALAQLRAKLGFRLAACHIHHGLRGAEADADAAHAAAQAQSHGIPFDLKRGDVRARTGGRHLSLEAAAREVRYQLLEEAAGEMGADRIATGHTADDQAETVLLNLLRGAGAGGLAGMPAVRGRIIRPLLEVRRAQAEAYCRTEDLAFRTDRSNQDLRFTRNRIRHRILPALREIQPQVDAALCRLAWLLREEDSFLTAEAARHLNAIALRRAGACLLPLPPFAELHPALQRRVARAAIAQVKGDELNLGLERVEALVNLMLAGRTGARIELPGRVQAVRSYGEVVISPSGTGRSKRARPEPTWDLPVPGQVTVPELDIRFAASRSTAKRPPRDAFIALIDAAAVTQPLQIRTWRAGDRFLPYGLGKRVKLQDFFVNRKIPRHLRKRVPLVVCGDRIVWVVGHRLSDEFKVTPDTRRTIRLQACSGLASSPDGAGGDHGDFRGDR